MLDPLKPSDIGYTYGEPAGCLAIVKRLGMEAGGRNDPWSHYSPDWTSRAAARGTIGREVLYAWLVWAAATEKRSPEAPFEYHDPNG
jgi:hypothetical protein